MRETFDYDESMMNIVNRSAERAAMNRMEPAQRASGLTETEKCYLTVAIVGIGLILATACELMGWI